MNANTQNILSTFKGSDDNWIDEDDAPEVTGAELYHPSTKFYVKGVEVSREVGMAAFGEKFRKVYAQQKQTIKITRFKQRGVQIRQQLAQMRQMTMQAQQLV